MSAQRPPVSTAELIARAREALAEGGDYSRSIAHALVAIAEQGQPLEVGMSVEEVLAAGPGQLWTLPAIPEGRKKYILWLDYGLEGWRPEEFDTLAECFAQMNAYGHCGDYRITRPVDVAFTERLERPAGWGSV